MNPQKGYQGFDIFRDYFKRAYLKVRGRKFPTLLTLYKEGRCSLGYKLLNHDTSKSFCMKEERGIYQHFDSAITHARKEDMESIMSKGCHLA